MFKIYDGRDKFYQWDVDRKLIIEDPSVTEVHFTNRATNDAYVCETYVEDGLTLVNVPNILLQTNWRIQAYAYDGKYTKHDKCYEVVNRSKPADYVYTETETKSVESIVANSLQNSYVPTDAYIWDEETDEFYYAATIPGITELKPGVIARIIPNADSYNACGLNVNGLGIKPISRYGGYSNFTISPPIELAGGKPIELVYDGEYWIITQMCKPEAGDIDGFFNFIESEIIRLVPNYQENMADLYNELSYHQDLIFDLLRDMDDVESALDRIIEIQQQLIGGAQ